MNVWEFFEKHQCNEFEKKALIAKLAEIRYELTLKMLKQVMR